MDDIFQFEGFRLDRRRGLFRRDERGVFVPMAIGSRALEVLGVLVGRAGDLVSRDEIIAAVWPTTVVEDNNLSMQITALRRLFDHGRPEGSCIQTVAGRGYRFIAPVTQVSAEARPNAAPLLPDSVPPLPDEPSLAVMPFQNMSGDPEQEYFADGMVEEIITALSRIRWMFVIARNSTFTYKGQPVDVKQVGRELGVRYVLEGSMRKAGQKVRITGQLIDAVTGGHLWADRFDGSLEDVFELQDKVASSVAGVIEPTLQAAEIRRSSERPTNDLTAYDIYLRALANFPWSGRVQMEKALNLFEQAIARDPSFAAALGWAAVCHTRRRLDGYAEDPETSRLKARSLAEQALALAGGDPGVLANVALVVGDDESAEISSAISLIDRSLALNPSSARAWFISGLLRVLAGEGDKAIEHVQTCLRLGPRDPVGVPLYVMGIANLFSRRFIEAAEKLALSVRAYSGWPPPYRALAACYAHIGRLDDAHAVIEQLRIVGPVMAPEILRYRRAEDRELLLSGLRLATGEAHNP